MSQLIDLTGRRFGLWTVEGIAEKRPNGKSGTRIYWRCRCDCGESGSIAGDVLKSGDSRSCGCNSREACAAKLRCPLKAAHPREYRIWQCMKARCRYAGRPRAERYIERGITVCERWAGSFAAFLEDMGPCPEGLSIERIDNHGHYEPGNCRWATSGEQARNSSANHLITLDGVTKPLCDWADERVLKRGTVERRINFLGWSPERALSTPPRRWGR